MLFKEYAEVSNTFRLLTDIRFKLLAFLPLTTGVAATVIATKTPDESTLALSMFGCAVTLGLVTYNARNDQLYDTLVSRAAAIERHLGDPDGAFANRPQAWLRMTNPRWKVDHSTGVATIYYATFALWLFGVANSAALLVYNSMDENDEIVPGWVGLIALGAALAVVATGSRLVKSRKNSVHDGLQLQAAAAVAAVIGMPIAELDQPDICERLSALAGGDVSARLRFLSALSEAEAARYVGRSDEIWRAALTVAYITDFTPEWIYDCKTGRRSQVGPSR